MLLCLQGSTLKHDGTKVVLFTKQEYRQLNGPITATGRSAGAAAGATVDEGEEGEEEDLLSEWQRKKRQKKAAAGSSSASSQAASRAGKWRSGRQQQRGRAAARSR